MHFQSFSCLKCPIPSFMPVKILYVLSFNACWVPRICKACITRGGGDHVSLHGPSAAENGPLASWVIILTYSFAGMHDIASYSFVFLSEYS